jgi:hypothetical protein
MNDSVVGKPYSLRGGGLLSRTTNVAILPLYIIVWGKNIKNEPTNTSEGLEMFNKWPSN